MNESPEIVGSMPSVPIQKPLQRSRSNSGSTWVYVGFLLYAVCAVAFPFYANTDRLGTGIFDGMGLMGLLLAIIGLLNELVKRVRRIRSAKLAEAGSGPGIGGRKNWSNNIIAGLFFMVLGVCLLVFPGATPSINGMGLLIFFVGLFILFIGLSRRSARNRKIEAISTGLNAGAQERRRASNTTVAGIYLLFLSIYFLVFPRGTSIDAYGRGLFYGMGFLLLLIAILNLSSGISRLMTQRVAPGK